MSYTRTLFNPSGNERFSVVCSNSGQDASRLSAQSDEGGGIAVETAKPKLAEPGKWAVYIHNDDYSTFDFVVEVLQRFFRKTSQEAAEITVRVHHEGKGLAGVFSHEIAETKVAQVEDLARERGYPLRATAEPMP